MNKWGFVAILIFNAFAFGVAFYLFCEGGRTKERAEKIGSYFASVIVMLIGIVVDYEIYLTITKSLTAG